MPKFSTTTTATSTVNIWSISDAAKEGEKMKGVQKFVEAKVEGLFADFF